MLHDLFSSLDSFPAISVAASALLVRNVTCQYLPAEYDEVLAARQLLAAQARGRDLMDSPAVVKDFLRARPGNLPHEIYAVVHLDAVYETPGNKKAPEHEVNRGFQGVLRDVLERSETHFWRGRRSHHGLQAS